MSRLLLSLFLCFIGFLAVHGFRKQRVLAKGRLLCGTQPAKNVLVKLYDEDDGKNMCT